MRVRDACRDDYAAIMRLLGQLNPDDVTASRAAGEAVLDRIIAAPGMHLLVLEHEGAIVSTCYLNVIANLSRGARPYALIENVVTDAAHRGRGFARAALGHAVERAWDAGCYKVMLMTGRADAAVHAFYRGCGFDGDEKHAFVVRRPGAS